MDDDEGTPPAAFDEAYYDANGQDADRVALWWYQRIAARMAPAGGRALDFGSGAGFFARRLTSRFDVDACDSSQVARRQIALNAPKAHVLAGLDEAPGAAYQLVTALHVLEHVPDAPACLGELSAKLAPGGRALLVVPNPDGLGHWLKGADWFAYRDPTHISLLHTSDWHDACTRSGLHIDQSRSDGLWDAPYIGGFPRWLQKPLFGAPAAAQVALGRSVLPDRWGECLVIQCTRQ